MVLCFGHFHFSEHEKLQCPKQAKAHNQRKLPSKLPRQKNQKRLLLKLPRKKKNKLPSLSHRQKQRRLRLLLLSKLPQPNHRQKQRQLRLLLLNKPPLPNHKHSRTIRHKWFGLQKLVPNIITSQIAETVIQTLPGKYHLDRHRQVDMSLAKIASVKKENLKSSQNSIS